MEDEEGGEDTILSFKGTPERGKDRGKEKGMKLRESKEREEREKSGEGGEGVS